MTSVTLTVRGMQCGGCEQRVRDAVAALPGVAVVTAEHIGDEVDVSYDPARIGLEQIEAAITGLGFVVGELQV